MEMKYIPDVCKAEGSPVKGELLLQMMSYPERNRLRKEVGLSQLTKTEDENDIQAKLENLEVAAQMAEKIFPLIKEVKLELADGTKIESRDHLYTHPACEDIITELIGKYLFGFVEKN